MRIEQEPLQTLTSTQTESRFFVCTGVLDGRIIGFRVHCTIMSGLHETSGSRYWQLLMPLHSRSGKRDPGR